MRGNPANTIENLNRLTYIDYYRKDPAVSYSVYKKTQLILQIIKYFRLDLKYSPILDIGFGSGFTLMNLSIKTSYLYGIEFIQDPCRNLFERMKTTGLKTNLLNANVSNLPFQDNYFHIIICSHVLEHIKQDSLALQEIWRVLSPNGILIFLTPNESYGNKHELHFRNYSLKDLKHLTKNKFTIIYRLKYRSVLDNFLYKIPLKLSIQHKLVEKSIFLDLLLAQKFKNLEDLYILRKKS
jgi:ubiquinone/menaquinone biosynthesis C-methylase UbiE